MKAQHQPQQTVLTNQLPNAPLKLPTLQKSYEELTDPRQFVFLYYKDDKIDTRKDFLITQDDKEHSRQRKKAQDLVRLATKGELDWNNIHLEFLDDNFKLNTLIGRNAIFGLAEHEGVLITSLSNVMSNIGLMGIPKTIIDLNAYQRAGVIKVNPVQNQQQKELEPQDINLASLWDENFKVFTNPIYLQSAQHYGQVAHQASQRFLKVPKSDNTFVKNMQTNLEKALDHNLMVFKKRLHQPNNPAYCQHASFNPNDHLTFLNDGALRGQDGKPINKANGQKITFNQFIKDILPLNVSHFLNLQSNIGTPSQKNGLYRKYLQRMTDDQMPQIKLNEQEKTRVKFALDFIKLRDNIVYANDTLNSVKNIKEYSDDNGMPAIPYNYGTNTGRQTNLNEINFVGISEGAKRFLTVNDDDYFLLDYDVSSLEYMTVIMATGNQAIFNDYVNGMDVYVTTGLKMEQSHPRAVMEISGQTYPLAQIVSDPQIETLLEQKARQDWKLDIQTPLPQELQARWDMVQNALTEARKDEKHPDHNIAQTIRQEGKLASLKFNYGAGSERLANENGMEKTQVDALKEAYFAMNNNQVKNFHTSLDILIELVASKRFAKNNPHHQSLLQNCQIYNKLDRDYLSGKTQAPLMVGINIKGNDITLQFRNGLPETLLDVKKESNGFYYTAPDGSKKGIYGSSLFAHCIQGLSARIMQSQDWQIADVLERNDLSGDVFPVLSIHDSKAFAVKRGSERACTLIKQVMSMAGTGYENTSSNKQNLFKQNVVFRTSETIGINLTGDILPNKEVLGRIHAYHQADTEMWLKAGRNFDHLQLKEVKLDYWRNNALTLAEHKNIQNRRLNELKKTHEGAYENQFDSPKF